MARVAVAIVVLSAAALVGHAQSPARDASPPLLATSVGGGIRGRVMMADSDVPVRRARVTLTPETGQPLDAIYSDSEGRFELAGVPPGRYAAAAWKSGYVETRFGARNVWDRHVAIPIVAGGTVDGLTLTLARGAAISGRIVDDFGEPIIGASVRVGRLAAVSGRPQFVTVGVPTDTDDLGEYRIGGLPAGAFIVSVFAWPPANAFAVPPDQRAGLFRMAMPHVLFYPQSPFITQARLITLRAGEDASAIDVTFGAQAASTPRVSGRIIDPQGRGTGTMLSAVTDGGGIPNAASGMNLVVPQTGEFALALLPGEYLLSAQTDAGVAMQHVSVGEADISGIQLVIAKGAHITGRVVFEGTKPRPSARMTVQASSREFLQGIAIGPQNAESGQSGVVSGGGGFEIVGVMGQRELRVNPIPPGWSVKSITAAGRDLLDLRIDFKGGEELRDVAIVLTDRETELAGTVKDDRQAPVSEVSVLVFPDDRRHLPGRARWVRPDSAGQFAVSGLPPGEYLAVLVDDVDDLQWTTAAYLDRFRTQATRVTLGDAERKILALQWSAGR